MSAVMAGLVLVAAAQGASAHETPSLDELFQRGEQAYLAGMAQRERDDPADRGEAQFRAAAGYWGRLRARGVDNALLLRDLGHAYFYGGDLPRAILCYRLGLRRDPGDVELRKGLRLARDRVVFAEGTTLGRPPEELDARWIPKLSVARLFALAALSYLAGWLCLTRWFMVRRGHWLAAGLGLLLVALWPGWLVVERQWRTPPPLAVVARDGVLLRKGNGIHFPPWSDVPLGRGVEAEQIYSRDGWHQVRLAGGEVGWLGADEVVVGDDPEAIR